MAKRKNNFTEHQETQRIESPPSSPSGNDKDHGDLLGFIQDTVSLDDNAWSCEQMETQVMDFECEDEVFPYYDETQAVPLGTETQEEPIASERQWLKASDCVDTQLLDHYDDEVAVDSDIDVTDILEDDSELSDVDSRSRNGLLDEVNIQHADERIKLTDVSDVLSREQSSSGNVAKFTSVRAAAFRASGLAARVANSKLPNSGSHSILTNCHSSDKGVTDTSAGNSVGEEVDQKANELRMGNKTARKLFTDDSPNETNCLSVDCDDELANLTYVDSQEPGEASQASALNFVEKLIHDCGLNFEVEIDHEKRTDEISKLVPNVKGPQVLAKRVRNRGGAVGIDGDEVDHGKRIDQISKFALSVKGPQVLAKKINYRGRADGIDIFEWDDNREDEGGGELLSRRKDEFFGTANHARGSSTVPKEVTGKAIHRSDSGRVNVADKRTAHSDSRLLRSSLMRNGRKVEGAGNETKKNLVNELDKVSKDPNAKTNDLHVVVDAGPDTQMAAEAIDALRLGDCNELDALVGKKLSLGEEQGFSSGRVVTRQSKRLKKVEITENDVEPSVVRTKKARSTRAKACEKNVEGSSNVDEPIVPSTGKRRRELSNEICASKLLNKSSWGRAEIYPKRRSARISGGGLIVSGRNSDSALDTPMKSKMPPKAVSPICMGDEYLRQSSKDSSKSNSFQEVRRLILPSDEPFLEPKVTRKRRDLGSVRVLFSQHLDEDVTMHQKKILLRFGISEASSMKEATHFVADKFVRTRNMLEAIASGKPVVTTQWLESIDQVKIYIDEDTYVLRDSKKEKEFGFNMNVTLARARQHPLLQGKRVLITPNTKPGLDTLTTLVKAVHGQAVERLGRSALQGVENLLILSCVEDYNICVPLLERGAEVYSSELLLNGIVTQKLEYERYHLFVDHVKRTRSTIWLRNEKGEFQTHSR